jgi:formiminoglutamase
LKILKPYSSTHIKKITRIREGERKLGDSVTPGGVEWKETLKKSQAPFVIVGIAEDIGVRANLGRPGAHSGFKPALDSFLNQQENEFLNGSQVIVLGEIYTADLMKEAEEINAKSVSGLSKLRALVSSLDGRVTEVVTDIVTAGKVPVIIGGGHNNSYGNIKGASQSLGKKVSVINCDPHLDFRELEGRHSGNGFSYAYTEQFLNKYAVLCMHEQYNNRHAISEFRQHPRDLFFETFEKVFVREEISFKDTLANCIAFVGDGPCGIEMDLDAISNVPSSARTSSGITALQARQYVHACAQKLDCVYLHIAEAAPVLSHIRADIKTGKLIAYLVSDFMKGRVKGNSD